MQSMDPATLTVQQQTLWDRVVGTYTEVVISKDSQDFASQQVIATVKDHNELATGNNRA